LLAYLFEKAVLGQHRQAGEATRHHRCGR
jgi:hypothetical protein